MTELEQKIGYEFCDGALLKRALTHSSYANEHGLAKSECNERLEFLGDSVLSVVASEYLYALEPKLPEGELTRARASMVCETALYHFANDLGLGRYMRFSRGEKNTGGDKRPSILADCFEALIAAMFLDGGMAAAKSFILSFIASSEHIDETPKRDYKTELQEVVQKNGGEKLSYALVKEEGPDHSKVFTVEVHLNSNVLGSGKGKNKKQAEQAAAREALLLMGM